jgi:hypothetical protein
MNSENNMMTAAEARAFWEEYESKYRDLQYSDGEAWRHFGKNPKQADAFADHFWSVTYPNTVARLPKNWREQVTEA